MLGKNYNSFLLTIPSTRVGFFTVVIVSLRYLILKVEIHGMPHPRGTCVLLEVNTLNERINYFQGLYQNPDVLFELRGVNINEKQCDMTDNFLINSC